MIIMMAIPIILTVVPVMLYQVILSLCKRKSTSTHYFWTYTMMIYIWLVFSVSRLGDSYGKCVSYQRRNDRLRQCLL